MTIKTSTVVKNEIEVELPLFWKDPNSEEYLGIIDDETAISFMSGTYSNVTHCATWIKANDIEKAHTGWIAISEEIFMDAHERFLSSLSLKPILVTHSGLNEDDLKGIL